MGAAATAWLPAGAACADRLQPDVDSIVASWSGKWIRADRASASPAFQDDWPLPDSGADFRSVAETVSAAMTPAGQLALAAAMVGSPPPHGAVQPRDRLIAEGLAAAAVEDLVRRFAQLAGAAKPDPAAGAAGLDSPLIWDIALSSGRKAVKLALSAGARIGIVRRRLAPAARPRLVPLASGLGAQRVELSARLGRCGLTLDQLRDLAKGDVLVLDRPAAGPVELLVDGLPSPLRGEIEAGERGAGLRLNSMGEERNG